MRINTFWSSRHQDEDADQDADGENETESKGKKKKKKKKHGKWLIVRKPFIKIPLIIQYNAWCCLILCLYFFYFPFFSCQRREWNWGRSTAATNIWWQPCARSVRPQNRSPQDRPTDLTPHGEDPCCRWRHWTVREERTQVRLDISQTPTPLQFNSVLNCVFTLVLIW